MRRESSSNVVWALKTYLLGVLVVVLVLCGIWGLGTSDFTYLYCQTQEFQNKERMALKAIAVIAILWPIPASLFLRLVGMSNPKSAQ